MCGLSLTLDELVEFVFVGFEGEGIDHNVEVGFIHAVRIGHLGKGHAVLRECEFLGNGLDLHGSEIVGRENGAG